jgi:hypothetical protein
MRQMAEIMAAATEEALPRVLKDLQCQPAAKSSIGA